MKTLPMLRVILNAAAVLGAVAYGQVLEAQTVPPAWHLANDMPIRRNWPGAVVGGDGLIYVIGGEIDGNAVIDVVERYNEFTDQWESLKPLTFALAMPMVISDRNGQIWVFGGQAGPVVSDKILRYDSTVDQWPIVGQMPYPRAAAVPVLGGDGCIYIVGGWTQTENATRLVQKFDAVNNMWTDMPSMLIERYSFACCLDEQNRLYALAGNSKIAHLSSVEYLDLNNVLSSWTFIDPMPSGHPGRQLQGCRGDDGRFYLAGGWMPGFTAHVDCFEPSTGAWSTYSSLNYPNNTMAVLTGASGRIFAIGGELAPMRKSGHVEYTDPYPRKDPVILKQPLDQETTIGQQVGMRISAIGTPPLDYRWQKDGHDLFDDGHITGAHSSCLLILGTSMADQGDYTVDVSSANGSVRSAVATLTVIDTQPPAIYDVVATPSILWPPNNKYVDVMVKVVAYDNSGFVTSRIDSVSSNQTGNPQRGPDWEQIGPLSLKLRATRWGIGERVYTIVVESTDPSGNSALASCRVVVPHDYSGM